MAAPQQEELLRLDQHIVHPLFHPEDHTDPLIFVEGKGAILKDIQGKEYIDGLACLWNVNVGHGREELADAAAQQMRKLAFVNAYTGSTNIPAIQLAAKLAELAYPNLNHTFFASGGAESNESAFKTARWYWKAKGQPGKYKVIARMWAYHGVTLAAMSATGIPSYWTMFEPRVPGFSHIDAPYRIRCKWCSTKSACTLQCADALEDKIVEEGKDTVAAFIAEPVQGAGGVLPPPDGYFQRIREICDRNEVLFIADEVITGFGRTGKWFALDHWGVQPDMMTFAKGVTSAYLPLGGVMVSDEIKRVMDEVPPSQRYMHAFTYSGHATCCAVGNRNIQIIEDEDLPARAAKMGTLLVEQLSQLQNHPNVGEVRGFGLMAAVELVKDREKMAFFEPGEKVGEKVFKEARNRGAFIRARGDAIVLAPPLVTTESQIEQLAGIVQDSVKKVLG
ncbi:MAG: aspartate aminotransferase family protein [Chloroflexi bacterium]|nr:aspartate aminotransferase family protein [Chloroflexota bacterium]